MITEKDCEKYIRIVDSTCFGILGYQADIYPEIRDKGLIIHVSVEPEDMGKIIGKGGKTASLLRDLLKQVGYMNNSLVTVSVHNDLKVFE